MQLSDTNLNSNILNIGRRRERVRYLKPDGNYTLPLPADPYSLNYYGNKGFIPEGNGVKRDVTIDGVLCPFCDFNAKNALGLRTHLTKHVGKIKEKEET